MSWTSEQFRNRYVNDEEFRERRKKMALDRYNNDPVYRENVIRRAKAQYQRSKEKKELQKLQEAQEAQKTQETNR